MFACSFYLAALITPDIGDFTEESSGLDRFIQPCNSPCMLKADLLKKTGLFADPLFEISKDGTPIATLNEKKLTFDHDGKHYTVSGHGVLTPEYKLNSGETAVATATQAALGNRYAVNYEGREWTLKAEGLLAQKYGLFQNDTEVGTISAGGFLSRFKGITVDLPDELPHCVQIFLLLLLISKWSDTSN